MITATGKASPSSIQRSTMAMCSRRSASSLRAVGAYYGMRAELSNMDLRVAKIELTLQQLANVLVLSARQDERLIALERRLDRLEQPPSHR